MQIIDVGVYTIEVVDERNYHSSVTKHNGKWYCLRCSRFRCEHAQFVAEHNPQFVEVTLDPAAIAAIIDED